MTFGECFERVQKLLNYYSAGGVVIGEEDGERQDLRARVVALVDDAQHELTAVSPVRRQIALACRAPKNRISGTGFHRPSEEGLVFALPDARAHAFSLRTAFALTIEVRQGSRTLASVATEDTPRMEAYTGVFEPQGEEPVKLVVRGTGLCADAALYAERFDEAAKVPVFGLYCDYALPADCRRVERVDLRPVLGRVIRDTRDYRTREGKLALPWSFAGEARVTYAAYPEKVGDGVRDDEELTVTGDAARAVVYFAAAGLTAQEDPELSAHFTRLYREILEKLPVGETGLRVVPALFSALRTGGRL